MVAVLLAHCSELAAQARHAWHRQAWLPPAEHLLTDRTCQVCLTHLTSAPSQTPDDSLDCLRLGCGGCAACSLQRACGTGTTCLALTSPAATCTAAADKKHLSSVPGTAQRCTQPMLRWQPGLVWPALWRLCCLLTELGMQHSCHMPGMPGTDKPGCHLHSCC